MARRLKKDKKENKKASALILIFVLVSIIIVALYYGSQHTEVFNQGAITRTDEDIRATVAVNVSNSTQYASYRNLVVMCDNNGVRALGTDANYMWQLDMNLNNPMLSVADKYILVADRGGKDITVINSGKVIHSQKVLDNIISTKATSSGNYIIISEEPYFKGKVSVKNLRGEDIFVYKSGNAYVLDADISND